MNRLTIEERKKANKIRCKLLYTIDRDIRQSKKNNKKQFLINSMTLQEIEDKFLLFPNYKIKISTTFTKIANKYMVMKTVDKKTNQNFFYSDYLQDKKKGNLYFVKTQRKKASANNIYKVPFLTQSHEIQSPIMEFLTNKVCIGDKKLIKPEEKISFSYRKNSKCTVKNEFDNDNSSKNEKKKLFNSKYKEKNNINNDDSVNSLTLELLQKKANYLSTSLNNIKKEEIKRRKKQLEAIKKLRQYCFTNLRNKRKCMPKSSHPNLIYINKKFDEEEEKNDTSNSSNEKNNRKYSKKVKNKIKNNYDKNNSKNNSKKTNELVNKSKKRKNNLVKIKVKKKMPTSVGKKNFRKDSSKKSPVKLKNLLNPRKSLILHHNIITEKSDENLNKVKRKKKDKNDTEKINNSKNDLDDNILLSKNKNHMILKKKSTGIIGNGMFRQSFREKSNKFFFINQPKIKNKNNIVIINEFNTTTKRTCSATDFFKKKSGTKKLNLFSTKNIINTINNIKIKEATELEECQSYRHRRFSIQNKRSKKNLNENQCKEEPKSEKSFIIINNVEDMNNLNSKKNLFNSEKKEKQICKKFKGRNTQVFNIDKMKIKTEMYKVEEEDS
jgi:hypothetical protein